MSETNLFFHIHLPSNSILFLYNSPQKIPFRKFNCERGR
jgi:hypothetical protein